MNEEERFNKQKETVLETIERLKKDLEFKAEKVEEFEALGKTGIADIMKQQIKNAKSRLRILEHRYNYMRLNNDIDLQKRGKIYKDYYMEVNEAIPDGAPPCFSWDEEYRYSFRYH